MADAKPHFSFWIIAGAGLVWNLMGCLNYITQSNPETVAQMPPVYQAIIEGRPAWATAGFAIGVFGGAVGCILLLLRRVVALPVFILSCGGVLLTSVFTVIIAGLVPSMVLSILVAAALIWYASITRRFGWLN